jgi:hypothetical protein
MFHGNFFMRSEYSYSSRCKPHDAVECSSAVDDQWGLPTQSRQWHSGRRKVSHSRRSCSMYVTNTFQTNDRISNLYACFTKSLRLSSPHYIPSHRVLVLCSSHRTSIRIHASTLALLTNFSHPHTISRTLRPFGDCRSIFKHARQRQATSPLALASRNANRQNSRR